MTKPVRWIVGLVVAFVLLITFVLAKEAIASSTAKVIVSGLIFAGLFAVSAWIKNGGKND